MKAILGAFLAATSASAAELRIESTVTPGASSLRTSVLMIEVAAGESLRGFDAEITGPVRHESPFGSLPTVFADTSLLDLPADFLARDSHFLFRPSEVLSIGAEEGEGFLRGAISGLASLDLPNPTPIAQIVSQEPWNVTYDLAFDLGTGEPVVFRGRLVPEPSGPLVAMAMGLAGCVLRRRV